MIEVSPPASDSLQALAALLDLSRRARQAASARELGFLLVNDSHGLASYRQAALWLADEGVHTLSGLVQVESNAPYALWLSQLCRHLSASELDAMRALTAADVPPELAQHWTEWWPAHALWLALPLDTAPSNNPREVGAGLLLVRDAPWPVPTQTLLREWADTWWHAFRAVHRPRVGSLQGFMKRIKSVFKRHPGRSWWRQPAWRWSVLAVAVMALPVRLTVMAPGELVPGHPVVVRAPLDGVVDVFHVQPNQSVKKDQPLFGFDEALIQSRLAIAAQTLATAETEYRQTSQQALTDAKFRPQLSVLTGKIEEKRTEVDFLNNQLTRARVLAPQDGVALFDDPTEWIGRPVAVGERIMRIAAPQDTEVEAWLSLADAIALPPGAPVNLYLNASPLFAVSATLRYMAHDAVQRPDGSYAYRVRAALQAPTAHRVGLKGTAKLNGAWVPLVYWVLRRPLASVRSALGI
ncbi:MAG: HlyD family efflux transporter periplasmic adaptor subunit [Gammaproteobacteria bacterium]|uniref:efflux RND transporter periplasmic adaptor subunit n=1 Tax=Rhodoferax sp. TaxID=50421 RepID=UPI0017E617C7|nr:HlyD family efflux transporter periplasmic adaptor subunit [Rhodoferax sp.]MBU3900657.1 HlyD family efflux transporter periplasmic adaptor subunit [Gammaproteobacteria bacterium]MBA3057710.1 HlyD family efflux transporter periplasmic adaptor subunit [Rhodoferax sp.]MBU3996672.1 HlyD family efflux transporter periplasmic adaptor subunit [Gammaproteobacteria bacterium]MBU4080966.1 HlyD family efflux transporter periplasmic adaptor subunit [Gammaproteobacteria bacterium]MBU4112025.1 HlyD famil